MVQAQFSNALQATKSHTSPHQQNRIKKLPPLLVNQLAAGEIVTRPAAVVKELLENAIDAGATQIEIKIAQGGMGSIQISDNGSGIHSDDMVMAVTRHATSKIADVANLQGIATLGFRGEALASIAAVSRLTLTSSADDSGIGRQLSLAGILDDAPKLTPVIQPQGTTVLVKDLYFNVPARRGNLKSIATEYAHIEAVVRDIAIAYADVSLALYHEQKLRLRLPAHTLNGANSANLADFVNPVNNSTDCQDVKQTNYSSNHAINRLPLARFEQALGASLAAYSLPLSVDLSGLTAADADVSDYDNHVLYDNHVFSEPSTYQHIDEAKNPKYTETNNPKIEGWLWLSADKNNNFPKLIYVNGRLIKDNHIASQMRQAMQLKGLANYGYALYFNLPSHWLNVNVHPSKQRIKIQTLANIMAHLDYAVKNQLNSKGCHDILSVVSLSKPAQSLPVNADERNTNQHSHLTNQHFDNKYSYLPSSANKGDKTSGTHTVAVDTQAAIHTLITNNPPTTYNAQNTDNTNNGQNCSSTATHEPVLAYQLTPNTNKDLDDSINNCFDNSSNNDDELELPILLDIILDVDADISKILASSCLENRADSYKSAHNKSNHNKPPLLLLKYQQNYMLLTYKAFLQAWQKLLSDINHHDGFADFTGNTINNRVDDTGSTKKNKAKPSENEDEKTEIIRQFQQCIQLYQNYLKKSHWQKNHWQKSHWQNQQPKQASPDAQTEHLQIVEDLLLQHALATLTTQTLVTLMLTQKQL